MFLLLTNAKVINVFSCEIENADILIKDDVIVGVGDYKDVKADKTINLNGKYVCSGFIDGHIHIESTMLSTRHTVLSVSVQIRDFTPP